MKYCFNCMMPIGTEDICPFCGYACKNNEIIPAHILPPGTVLRNRFLLGNTLGQGGFGITYIGRDLTLNLLIAVKEYYPTGYANRSIKESLGITAVEGKQKQFIAKGKERFLQEAQVLAQFHGNPGIVDIRDYFEENNTAYIIMDYLDGDDLRDVLKRKLFSADEIFALMSPVFRTLEQVHSKGIIHRDISPDNIMMLKDGTLKLMDFGAARLANYADQRSVSVVLKTGYAPEEQYRPKGKQGPWTDIYALCATIYKCITGITPDDALERLINDQIKWPSEMGIPISVTKEQVLKKGMAVMAKDRFQSLEEMITALEENNGTKDISGAEIGFANRDNIESPNIKPQAVSDGATEYDASDDRTVYDAYENEKTVYEQSAILDNEEVVTVIDEQPQKGKGKTGNHMIRWAGIAGIIFLAIVFIYGISSLKNKNIDNPENIVETVEIDEEQIQVPTEVIENEVKEEPEAQLGFPALLDTLCKLDHDQALEYFREHDGDTSEFWEELQWVPEDKIYYSLEHSLIGLQYNDEVMGPSLYFFFFDDEGNTFEYGLHVMNMGDDEGSRESAQGLAEGWEKDYAEGVVFEDTHYTSWGNCLLEIGGPGFTYGSLLEGSLINSMYWMPDCWNLYGVEPVNYDTLDISQNDSESEDIKEWDEDKIETDIEDPLETEESDGKEGQSQETAEDMAERIHSFKQFLDAGPYQTVALMSDGTVDVRISPGYENWYLDSTSAWNDIGGVVAGEYWTYGIRNDGSVIACGAPRLNTDFKMANDMVKEVVRWKDIVKLDCVGGNDIQTTSTSEGDETASTRLCHTIGLRYDGTVVAAGENQFGECDVEDWTDIVDIAAGWKHTLGLKSDGTVIAVGDNAEGQCDIEDWTDIVQITAAKHYSFGLKSDGTVVVAGGGERYPVNKQDIASWKNIVRIYAANDMGTISDFVYGIQADGRVVYTESYRSDSIQSRSDSIQSIRDSVLCVGSSWGYTAYLNSEGGVYAYALDKFDDFFQHDVFFDRRLGEPIWTDVKTE